MKKLFITMASMLFVFGAFAQMPQNLPLDPKVRSGKLDNGLTYFVMQNSEPESQADFYIVQKVGSILEEENQRGLAHFLEHMAFNGTTSFPENEVVSYLETIGVKFGANLNAYTAIDQTVYNIASVPVKREGIIDSCLLILHDWANEITLKDVDIDKERGVIREELRTRNNAQMRMIEKILPDIMPDSKYAHRLPGGLVKVIDNFTYAELRDYYNKWYRPDLQGIVVVGDIDPEAVEQKIKKMFGEIPMPEDASERTEFEVPDNEEPLIGVVTDPEATSSSIMLMYKKDVMPKEFRPTATSMVFNYINSLVRSMLNSRLSEIAQKANSPYTSAGASYGDFIVSNTKKAFSINAGAKENGIDKALEAITKEAEKIRRYGFTASELERAKANYSSNLEQLYKERNKLKNNYFVQQLVNHFLTDEAYPGLEAQYAMMQQIEPMITLDQVNSYAMSLPTEENVIIAVMMPEKEGIEVPSKENLLDVFNQARAAEVAAYEDEVSDEPLISEVPTPGKIISEVEDPMSGAKVWNLSNGAIVVVKQTDFKEDQILFNASSRGGYSLFDKEDILATKVVNDVISVGGLGNFSSTDLKKVLAGKNVSLRSSVSMTSETLGGNSAPKDLETLLQLIHLNFTSIRQDDEAFEAYLGRMEAQLKNAAANPMMAYSDTLYSTLYKNSPYAKRLNIDMLDHLDYEKTLELGRKRFSNAADFTFTFVGNIDEQALRNLAETYIASLPANKGNKETWKKVDYNTVNGVVSKVFEKEMQAPKATVYTVYTGDVPYTVENKIMASMTEQILNMIFTRTIREEEEGTYGVGVQMDLSYYPTESFMFLFGFDTDVQLRERLLTRAYKEIDNVLKKGVEQDDFSKVIEYMTKNHTQNLKENSYWLSAINTRYLLGKDMHTTYETALNSVTPEKLNEFMNKLFSQGNRVEIIMDGVAAE